MTDSLQLLKQLAGLREAGPGDPNDVFGRKAVGPEIPPMVPASRYMPSRPSPGSPELRADPSMRNPRSTPGAENAPRNITPYKEVPTWAPGQPNPPGMAPIGQSAKPSTAARVEPNFDVTGSPVSGRSGVQSNVPQSKAPGALGSLGLHGAIAAGALAASDSEGGSEQDPAPVTPFGQIERVPQKDTVYSPEKFPQPPANENISRMRKLAGLREEDPPADDNSATVSSKPADSSRYSDPDPSDPDAWMKGNEIPLGMQPGVMTTAKGNNVVNPATGPVVYDKGRGGGGGGGSPASTPDAPAPAGTPAKDPSPNTTKKGDTEEPTIDGFKIIVNDPKDLTPAEQKAMQDQDKAIAAKQASDAQGTPPDAVPTPPGSTVPVELFIWKMGPDGKPVKKQASDAQPPTTSDELERIAKLAGIPPQEFPKGKAAEPGPTVITDPMADIPSTGDVNLPPASDTTKPYITGEPEKNYDKTEQPPQNNPVKVKPDESPPEPSSSAQAFRDLLNKLPAEDPLEPPQEQPEEKPQEQPEEKPQEQPPLTPPKTPAPSYARPTPTTGFNIPKPAEKPPEPEEKPAEPVKTPVQPAPSYSRPSPTGTFDKPVEKPADPAAGAGPAQTSQTQPAPTLARPASTGSFNTPQQQPAQTKPADQGKPKAPTNNKFTPDGYELATDDPNDNRPTTYDNQGKRIIDPYITKGAVTPGGREAFAQKEFGTSAEERARRAGGGGRDDRDREYNMSPGGGGKGYGRGPGEGPGTGPGTGSGQGGGQGAGRGTGAGDGEGPGGGRWRNHDWVVFKNPFTGSYSGGSKQETDWLNSGQDLSGFEKVGPGQYVSKHPFDHPEYDPKKHGKPPNAASGSYEGEKRFYQDTGSSRSQPITVNPPRRESTDYSIGAKQLHSVETSESVNTLRRLAGLHK